MGGLRLGGSARLTPALPPALAEPFPGPIPAGRCVKFYIAPVTISGQKSVTCGFKNAARGACNFLHSAPGEGLKLEARSHSDLPLEEAAPGQDQLPERVRQGVEGAGGDADDGPVLLGALDVDAAIPVALLAGEVVFTVVHDADA